MERISGSLNSCEKITHLNGNLHLTDRTGINMRQKLSITNTTDIKDIVYRQRYRAME